MMALIGHEVPFNRGRQQLKLLADLTVTTKAVERTAEAVGRDILAKQHKRSAVPSNWNCPLWPGLGFRFCTFRSTVPVYQ